MTAGYYNNGEEMSGFRMTHVIDITLERRLGIAVNDTVDRILRVHAQVRWSRLRWCPGSIGFGEAQKYEPASIIGKRQNRLGKIRFVLFR
jgi:hypothetical protein